MGLEVLILYKSESPEARTLAYDVRQYVQKFGYVASIAESPLEPASAINATLIIVIGGDGTLLGLARSLAQKPVPIFGIKLGNVGFLACADPQNWRERLDKALQGELETRDCLLLNWDLERNGRQISRGLAFNEVVISRGALARLINLQLNINKHSFGTIRCDGLIVCSPSGSSAYAASAGGPVIQPALQVTCLTAICAYPVRISPVVLPGNTSFEIRHYGPPVEGFVTIDGQQGFELLQHDLVRVKGLEKAVRLFGTDRDYIDKLLSRNLRVER